MLTLQQEFWLGGDVWMLPGLNSEKGAHTYPWFGAFTGSGEPQVLLCSMQSTHQEKLLVSDEA
jgi:hypothetical protein